MLKKESSFQIRILQNTVLTSFHMRIRSPSKSKAESDLLPNLNPELTSFQIWIRLRSRSDLLPSTDPTYFQVWIRIRNTGSKSPEKTVMRQLSCTHTDLDVLYRLELSTLNTVWSIQIRIRILFKPTRIRIPTKYPY